MHSAYMNFGSTGIYSPHDPQSLKTLLRILIVFVSVHRWTSNLKLTVHIYYSLTPDGLSKSSLDSKFNLSCQFCLLFVIYQNHDYKYKI